VKKIIWPSAVASYCAGHYLLDTPPLPGGSGKCPYKFADHSYVECSAHSIIIHAELASDIAYTLHAPWKTHAEWPLAMALPMAN